MVEVPTSSALNRSIHSYLYRRKSWLPTLATPTLNEFLNQTPARRNPVTS